MGLHGEHCACTPGTITPSQWLTLRFNPEAEIKLTEDGDHVDFTQATAALYSSGAVAPMTLYVMNMTTALHPVGWEPAWSDLMMVKEGYVGDPERELQLLDALETVRGLFALCGSVTGVEGARTGGQAIKEAIYGSESPAHAWMLAFIVADLCCGAVKDLDPLGRYTIHRLADRALNGDSQPALPHPLITGAIAKIMATVYQDEPLDVLWNSYAERDMSWLITEQLVNELAISGVPGAAPTMLQIDEEGLPSAVSTPAGLADNPEHRAGYLAAQWISGVCDGVPFDTEASFDDAGDDIGDVALCLVRSYALQMAHERQHAHSIYRNT